MNYIKINPDNSVIVGGTVANDQMIKDGWIKYNGDIPNLTNEFQSYKWDGANIVVIEDTEQLKEQARLKIKAIKDEALNNNTYTLQDGSVYQFRISDAIYFSNAITYGEPVDWVLADNTIRNTTVAELQEIYTNGSAQIKQIMTDYTTALKGI